jgi:hypothetical protein
MPERAAGVMIGDWLVKSARQNGEPGGIRILR